jgi:thiol reductant ABC exporter CydC subunit
VKGTPARLVALAGVGRGRLALSVLLGSLTILFGVGLVATAGYLISRAAEGPPILALGVAIVAVRFFGLARPVARYLDRLWSHDLALRSLSRIRRTVYARIEPLAPAQLSSFRRGDLLARMVADVDSLQGVYLRGIGPALVAAVAAAACVGSTAAVDSAAAEVLAVGLLVGGVAVPILASYLIRTAGRRQAAARAALTADLVELFRAAPELVVLGAGQTAVARIRVADRELVRLGRRDALVGGLAEGLSVLTSGLTVVAVLAVAAHSNETGTLDRVLVAALALVALASFEAVAPLVATGRELPATLGAGRRVLHLIGTEPDVLDPVTRLPVPARPVVALERVTARYGGAEQPAVVDADLRLEPGRSLGLVGPSGVGKTTVVNLLLRFLDPEVGRVTLDGNDLRDYRQEDVRGVFAYAGQDAHVFNSTIRENLALARPGAPEAALVDALRRARLDEWVASLPQGLDTVLGEDGTTLSGGQRQRLVVARALLSDAPVLLLDEPTAHLDGETAQALVGDILEGADGRSVLLITHRTEGLELVDDVVALG